MSGIGDRSPGQKSLLTPTTLARASPWGHSPAHVAALPEDTPPSLSGQHRPAPTRAPMGGGPNKRAAVSSCGLGSPRLARVISTQRERSHGMMFSKCLLSISRVGDLM